MNHRSYLFTIGLLVVVLLLVGCAKAPTAQADLPVVRYANFKVFDPVYVAIDKGFFEAHGIKVEIIGDVLAGPTAIQAVSSGAAEAALSSVPAIINANAAGLPIQGVVDVQTTIAGGEKDQALQRWYVLKDSPIQSIQDVVGKKFAINLVKSSFNYTALWAMMDASVDPSQVEWPLLSFDKQIPALINGSVDVIGLIEPYQTFLQKEYGDQVRELMNDRDDVFKHTMHVSLIFVNRIWAANNPDQAEAFVAGIVDAIAWIEANPDAAKPIESKYTGIPEESIPVYHYTESGLVDMASVQKWMEFLKSQGDLKAEWVTAENVATNAYNPAASGK